MSDASTPVCPSCKEPQYACSCDIENMTDQEVLDDAVASGLDPDAEANRIHRLLLDAADRARPVATVGKSLLRPAVTLQPAPQHPLPFPMRFEDGTTCEFDVERRICSEYDTVRQGYEYWAIIRARHGAAWEDGPHPSYEAATEKASAAIDQVLRHQGRRS